MLGHRHRRGRTLLLANSINVLDPPGWRSPAAIAQPATSSDRHCRTRHGRRSRLRSAGCPLLADAGGVALVARSADELLAAHDIEHGGGMGS
jgi:hypothetical protein